MRAVFCPKCGSALDDDACFCGACGGAVARGAIPAPPPSSPVKRLSGRSLGFGVAVVGLIAVVALAIGVFSGIVGRGANEPVGVGSSANPFAPTVRYGTVDELMVAATEACQLSCDAPGDLKALMASRKAVVNLLPTEALDIMLETADVESVDALAALIGGFQGLTGATPEATELLDGFEIQARCSVGNDLTPEEMGAINERLHASGMGEEASHGKKVDITLRVVGKTAEAAQAAAQFEEFPSGSFDAIEVGGSWCLSPVGYLTSVVEGCREVEGMELATFTSGRTDGVPVLSFTYPKQWEPHDSVGSEEAPTPLGPHSEMAGVSSDDHEAQVSLYYCGNDWFGGDQAQPASRAVVTKIRDAAFDPAGAGAGRTDAGPYVVAEVAYGDPMEGSVVSLLALVPASFVGERSLSAMQEDLNLPFQCAGQSVIFDGGRMASSFTDRQAISRVLGSLTII